MKFRFLSFFLLLSIFLKAQTSPQLNSSDLLLAIKKLGVTGSVLYVAAHPDDENTRLLAYLAKGKHYKTGYLSLTRGDGGQNLIGTEQAEDLGLIRTQELIAARGNDGAVQFFTRANDFGYSKTAEETFKIWDKDSILSDVVYIIRKFRPDVIITRFPTDERAGHGHHAASSILAQEAFTAAADPKRFPDQLKEVDVWQAKRILWNNYNFGGNDNTSDNQFKIDVGLYNNLLGKSYGEIAAESRSMHKSQGFGSAKQRGSNIEYFSSWKGALPKTDLMQGIVTNWSRLPEGNQIDGAIADVVRNFNPQEPAKSITGLTDIYRKLVNLPKSGLKTEKIAALKDLILACGGVWFEAYSNTASNAVHIPYQVKVDAIAQIDGVNIIIKDWDKQVKLAKNQLSSLSGEKISEHISQPYWLEMPHPIGRYQVNDQRLLLDPAGKPADSVQVTVNIAGVSLDFLRPIVYKYTDPVRGEVYKSVSIAPPVTVSINAKTFIFTDNQSKSVKLKLKSFKANTQGSLLLSAPKGWKISPEKIAFDLKDKEEEKDFSITLTSSPNAVDGPLEAKIIIGKETYNKSYQVIDYEHIPSIAYFPPAQAKLVKIDLKTTVKNIGYITGAGDLIPESLREIGLNVTMLSEDDLRNANLLQYDAIIAGIRLYNVNERMKFVQEKLMKYVEGGGVYLVQYNVNRPMLIDQIGPYPFTIARDRVTEEDAQVNFLKPDNSALNYPNKITKKDFDGWIQERGIYFANNSAKEYEKPLSMKDTGEKDSDGSLLIAKYGKGKFVYTGLSFFRELPAGVPGAYRLFLNLLAK